METTKVDILQSLFINFSSCWQCFSDKNWFSTSGTWLYEWSTELYDTSFYGASNKTFWLLIKTTVAGHCDATFSFFFLSKMLVSGKAATLAIFTAITDCWKQGAIYIYIYPCHYHSHDLLPKVRQCSCPFHHHNSPPNAFLLLYPCPCRRQRYCSAPIMAITCRGRQGCESKNHCTHMPRIQEVAYSFSLTGIHLPWKSTFKLELKIKVGSSICTVCTLNISVLSCVLEDRCINPPPPHCLDSHNRLQAHTWLIVLHECLMACWIFLLHLWQKSFIPLLCMLGRSEHWLCIFQSSQSTCTK